MRLQVWVLAALLAPPFVVSAQPVVTGRASVVDGDTITVNQKRVRLWGIDAPESSQQCKTTQGRSWPCGRRSANALDQLLDGKTIRCEQRDVDRYGRSVAECFIQGQSVNAWMVRSGWAVAYRQYSAAYVAAEGQAKRDKANIWQGPFQMPADYRKDKRSGLTSKVSAARPSTPGCVIKGNISSGGRKIFHSPGQRDYDRTRIDTKRGERYFCTATEAQRAGWRAAER